MKGVGGWRWDEGGHSKEVIGRPASWSIRLVPRVTDLNLDQSASLHGFLQPHSAV